MPNAFELHIVVGLFNGGLAFIFAVQFLQASLLIISVYHTILVSFNIHLAFKFSNTVPGTLTSRT